MEPNGTMTETLDPGTDNQETTQSMSETQTETPRSGNTQVNTIQSEPETVETLKAQVARLERERAYHQTEAQKLKADRVKVGAERYLGTASRPQPPMNTGTEDVQQLIADAIAEGSERVVQRLQAQQEMKEAVSTLTVWAKQNDREDIMPHVFEMLTKQVTLSDGSIDFVPRFEGTAAEQCETAKLMADGIASRMVAETAYEAGAAAERQNIYRKLTNTQPKQTGMVHGQSGSAEQREIAEINSIASAGSVWSGGARTP